MIGDLFENDSGSFGSNSTGTQKRGQDSKPKKRYIADDMDLPPVRRNPGEFSGLLNQGATCYLNALFQTYFFTPQFKRLLFSIDLDGTDTYEKHSDKYNVIKQFQLFFARLKYLGFKNQSTMVQPHS
jgi:ubiquitin C-terminal hydrolase